ncbi:MAG: hypothetical protein JST10_10370 [Bacteroidetes bacterium]|nr:hypothetical protein [Bacteroidota bacterium]
MKGQILKILFKDGMAFLTEEVALDLNQVQVSERPVKFRPNAYWTVQVINYIEKEKKLFVEVLRYQVGETEFPNNQIALADLLITIEKVTFRTIDTSGLLATLDTREPGIRKTSTALIPEPKIERGPIKRNYSEAFSIPIKDVTFHTGSVTVEYKLQGFVKPVKFEIENENILEEFDAIKDYFASVLNTKKIQVVASLETVDGEVIKSNATSVEIDKIDKTIIEEVKFEFVKRIRKNESEVDQQLFTKDEFLETFAEKGLKVKSLFKDENQFFDNILEMSATKHYKHLRFLSGRHKHDILKLRFVHRPFSFVFLLSGSDHFYIVWETLDTQEATYIWTIKKDMELLKQGLIHVDSTIRLIKNEGRNEYRNRKEDNFSRVYHDYTNSEMGFEIWKGEIERLVK